MLTSARLKAWGAAANALLFPRLKPAVVKIERHNRRTQNRTSFFGCTFNPPFLLFVAYNIYLTSVKYSPFSRGNNSFPQETFMLAGSSPHGIKPFKQASM